MFITAEDFNVQPFRLNNLDQREDFPAFVTEQEEDRLVKILGRLLYDAFVAGLYDGDGNPRDEGTIEQRWKDLRDGVKYTYNNKPYHWKGMKRMLKPFIYSQWTKLNEENNSGIGAVKPAAENSTVISGANMIVRGWNDFACKVGNQCEFYDTLYGYLYHSADKYLDAIEPEYTDIISYLYCVFEDPGTMNVFNF
jgi:hypothetical protein